MLSNGLWYEKNDILCLSMFNMTSKHCIAASVISSYYDTFVFYLFVEMAGSLLRSRIKFSFINWIHFLPFRVSKFKFRSFVPGVLYNVKSSHSNQTNFIENLIII